MARWNMYLDDSATHGALMDKMLRPRRLDNINGGTPVTSGGGILVNAHAERAINRDINTLRKEIQQCLGLSEPPELHMRLMWGKTLPVKDGLKTNPYLGVDRKQIFRWVRQAYDIIFKYGVRGDLHTIGLSIDLPQAQEVLRPYCEDERTKIEHDILYHYFPKAQADFYGIMLNPLIRLLMSLIAGGDYFATGKKCDLHVFYDTSEASKGFSISDGIEIFHELQYLPTVKEITESSPHENNLMQLADLVAYRVFRQKVMRYRIQHGMSHAVDTGMRQVLRNRDIAKLGILMPHDLKIESIYESLFAMLHIAYARQKIKDLYPELSEQLLIPLRSYHTPIDEHGSLTGFFPLIRDEFVLEWRNGKRPLLERPPVKSG